MIAKHYGCSSKNLYSILPALARYLEALDPQTEVVWETGPGEVYEFMAILSGAAKRAASGPGLVPVLSVDAAGMKGIGDRFPEGKLYLATMADGAKTCTSSVPATAATSLPSPGSRSWTRR